MARLGGRARRPPELPLGAAPRRVAGGGRAMAWWRARVVAPARRAWLAVVAGRLQGRNKGRAERAGIVDLHRDVQTCGYQDVHVMWDMLGLEATGPSTAPAVERRRRTMPFWTPSFWHFLSSRRAAAAQ